MRPVNAIVFDLEGTLFHCPSLSEAHTIAIINLIANKRNISRLKAEALLNSFRLTILKQLGFKPTMVTTVCALDISPDEFHQCIEKIDPSNFIQPQPELDDFLTKLKRKCKLGLLTNVGRKTTMNILHALSVRPCLFDAMLCGTDVCRSKPSQEPFFTISKMLEEPFDRIVMVGDRIYVDLAPAKKSGMKTVLLSELEKPSSFVDLSIHDIYDVARLTL